MMPRRATSALRAASGIKQQRFFAFAMPPAPPRNSSAECASAYALFSLLIADIYFYATPLPLSDFSLIIAFHASIAPLLMPIFRFDLSPRYFARKADTLIFSQHYAAQPLRCRFSPPLYL
jgi:hypothetical protein